MANKRILTVSAKTSDLCWCSLEVNGEVAGDDHDGYVPEFFPEGGGDYIALEIDIDTGQILNWKKPTQAQLKKSKLLK